jgi:YfiH family protein
MGQGGGVGFEVGTTLSDRRGGNSAAPYDGLNLGAHVGDDPAAVRANRAELAARCGLPPERLVFMHQVHGREAAVVDGPVATAEDPLREVEGVDALVTATPGLALAVLAADCVPVLLADPDAGVVAAAHAGRAGVLTGMVTAAVEAMVDLGAQPHRAIATLGPAVCGACYEVPAELQDEVARAVPAARSTTRAGTAGLDLRAGIRAQLAALGVREQRDSTDRCTLEDRDLFSHRRDGVTGRHAGLVWLRP